MDGGIWFDLDEVAVSEEGDTKQQAMERMRALLAQMQEMGGSDLFITAGFPPAVKRDGDLVTLGKEVITGPESGVMVRALMREELLEEFNEHKECNFAIYPHGIGRFRVSAYVQQGRVCAVLRSITTDVPELDELELPEKLKEIVLEKRGLVLVVGGTGSGKSTTLAAMINHRNHNSKGHIITIEDPVEFMHRHAGCIISQREVGVDTENWDSALQNTLRQSPDVILIGEIRNRDMMEYALQFAETGHLCLATLHANNASQALDRIINFAPEDKRHQLLMDLALNLKAVVCQRLVRRKDALGRVPAVEILLQSRLVVDLIKKGDVARIKEIMNKSTDIGMNTFDNHLFELYQAGKITENEALANADERNEVRMQIRMEQKRHNDAHSLQEGTPVTL